MAHNEMRHLCKMIHDNEDAIKTMRFWQASDKIHRNRSPSSRGNRQGLKESHWRFDRHLNALTHGTVFNVTIDVSSHLGPEVVSLQNVKCLMVPKVNPPIVEGVN